MIADACSIALYDGGAVLLVQRAFPPFEGLWTLPGGRIERGERAQDAICREVWEEFAIVCPSPIAVTTHTVTLGARRHALAVFAAFMPRQTPVVSEEIANWEWVAPAEMAALDTTPGLAAIVARCLAQIEEAGP